MRACGEAVVEPGEWECSLRGKMSRQRGHPVMGSQEGRQHQDGEEPHQAPGKVTEWREVLAVEENDQVCLQLGTN